MYSDQSTVETEIFQGKYQKIRELKTGGMGKVFLVEERRKKKRYIMKIVPADKKGLREAEYLEKAENLSGIPKIMQWEKNEHEIFMVMEYVRGNSLKELVSKKKRIGRRKLIRWGLALCEILQGLHQMEPPVICMDLKPEHVRITPAGKVYLIDLGISAYEGEELEGYGTKGFAAPEQRKKGSRADVRLDIFSFGKILDFCKKRMRWKGMETVIRQCTRKRQKDRYPSMAVLKQALKRERRRETLKITAALIIIFGLSAGIGRLSFSENAPGAMPVDAKREIQKYLFGDERNRPDYIMAEQCITEWQGKDSEISRYERLLDAMENPGKIQSWEVIWQDLRKNPAPGLYETCFLSQVYLTRQKQLASFGKPAWQAWKLLERQKDREVSGIYWKRRIEDERLQAAGNLALQGEEEFLREIAGEYLQKTGTQEEAWSGYRRVVMFLEREGRDMSSYYENFLQKFPCCEEAYVEYGIYLCRLGRWKEAQTIYRRGKNKTSMAGEKAGELKEKLGI